MGDPQGPWQDYGQDASPDERVPAHLPSSPRLFDDYSADYSDEWGYDEDPGDERSDGFLRRAVDQVLWRYHSAPLWLRATLDVGAVALVLAVVVAGALKLAGTGPSDEVSAFVSPTSTTAQTAGTPAPMGTTTTASTSTGSPTTTAVPPTTTTVARPTTSVPPPATTTTTRPRRDRDPGPPPHYDNCFEAWQAGALPLLRGDPGYGPHLDDDNDGIACEPGEGT